MIRGIFFSFLVLICISAFSQVDYYKSSDNNPLINYKNHPASGDYDVKYYHLDIELNNDSVYLSGTTRIDLMITDTNINSILLDLDYKMNVSEVRVNSDSSAYTHNNKLLEIPVSNPSDSQKYIVEVDYSGYPSHAIKTGIDQWGVKTTYSLSEPFYAKNWFPVKEDLLDKADSSAVNITIPDNLMAGSNGILEDTVNVGNNKIRYEWRSRYPIVYYLISFAIGDYKDYSFYAYPQGTTDSVLIQNFIYDVPGFLANTEHKILKTGEILEEFSDIFGIYPHHEEKYGHCITNLMGGMEHQTMSTMGDFDFNLVAHELAHSWFGNYVTCANWQDIWINEGFAVYSEYLAYKGLGMDSVAKKWIELTSLNAKMSQDGSVYVPFSEVNNPYRIFNTILTYKKGGMLLHMIRYILDNDNHFFGALQQHLQIYGDYAATGDDFKNVLENVSLMNFGGFFDQWYYGEGYPVYNVEWYQQNDTIFIKNNQYGSCSQAPVFTIPLEYRMYFNNGDSLMMRLPNDSSVVTHKLPETRQLDNLKLDPDMNVLCDKTVNQVTPVKYYELNYSVYPNPADDKVFIKTKMNNEYTISLHTANGKRVLKSNFYGYNNKLDVSGFENGVYFLKLSDELHNFKVKKLIIKNE